MSVYQDFKYKCELVHKLGNGCFGSVVSALDKDKQLVAIKIINKKTLFTNPHSVKLLTGCLINERTILEELRGNKMFTQLIHAEEGQYQFYFVMEYLPGGSLAEFVEQNRTGYEEVAKFFLINITNALKFLHTRGIIHRDIKAPNILLRKEGYPVIADFGIAIHTEQTEKLQNPIGTIEVVS